MSYLEPKVKASTNERVFPLVADFNPGLPNIGGILNENKHIKFLLRIEELKHLRTVCYIVYKIPYRRALRLACRPSASREQRYLAYNLLHSQLGFDNLNKNQSTLNQSGDCQPCEIM